MRLSDYVERDLEARIRAGDAPERLSLGALAASYGVSATPVRAALAGLAAKRLVARDARGRWAVRVPAARRSRVVPPDRPRDDRDEVLAQEVLRASLRGEDCFLREEAMAERHGLGRTQLRGAFARLAGAGLLEHVPRRGWRVPAFRLDDMDAYLAVRETLELQALELARGRLDAAELDAMLAGNDADAVARAAIDNRLHGYFVERAGNRYIAAFFESHGRFYDALFDYAALGAGVGPEVVAEMAGQHTAVLRAVRGARWDRARRALAHHIRSQKPVIEAIVAAL